MDEYDIFIAHASEDKEIATPLAKELQKYGLKIWYDDFILKAGDSLHQSINNGLAKSKYGVVILSESFFHKKWPNKELDGMVVREVSGKLKILPIWHEISKDEVAEYSPILADAYAIKTNIGIEKVSEELVKGIDDYPVLDFEDVKSIGISLKKIRKEMITEPPEQRGEYWEYTLKFNTPENVLPFPHYNVVFYVYNSVFLAKKRYPVAKLEDQQKVESRGKRLLIPDLCKESYGYTWEGRIPPYPFFGTGVIVSRRHNLIVRIEFVHPLDYIKQPDSTFKIIHDTGFSFVEAEKFAKIVDTKIMEKFAEKKITLF